MSKTHFLAKNQLHFLWNADVKPAIHINSGDTVILETAEITDGQITQNSTTESLHTLDWSRMYPLSGPIFVEGAEPGDTLKVEILDLHTIGWGWAAILGGFGLLADDFKKPLLKNFDLSDGEFIHFREDIKVPIEPFLGTMGVCPKDANDQSAVVPGTFGGIWILGN